MKSALSAIAFCSASVAAAASPACPSKAEQLK